MIVWKAQRAEHAKAHAFAGRAKVPLCGHRIPGKLVRVAEPETARRCIPCLDAVEELTPKGKR